MDVSDPNQNDILKVFLVDGGGGHPTQPPNLVPCWSFPPAQERMRSRGKSRGCMGISPSLAMVVLLLFLLVFAALGFEAYQILDIQKKMKAIEKVELEHVTEYRAPLKQIGSLEIKSKEEDMSSRPAAHVIGRIEISDFRKTLRWNSKTGQAFTSGGVAYRMEDGSLQVNETGLYHVYSRVELIFKDCSISSSFDHSVFVRRAGNPPLTLMETHRAGFCPPQPTHSWTTESYLGSTLQLMKNDKVFVNVSHPSHLSHLHHANFFGLYKI
ncbi:tumor necrosis factor ligand superfamily member 6 isoform X2 [Melanotaenia boesemani]|uniref:tumor necrosis factor ligand superfamily member 6 isoform X2 n=1 Tax=Melanotaenia boesemani TaxID=1250792 RepID=UPI001C046991|nr:tumor necrosis factor ligand superfamily member 6 isoform X2 [Melanotaenia boesemani]